MPVAKKNTAQKTSEKKKPKRNFTTIDDEVWFPEQLAKVNALLSKAILLPHGKNKK
jgi:hypothetical protein